jgi:hypothetical protein
VTNKAARSLTKPNHRRLPSAAVGIMLVGEKMLDHSERWA